MSKKKLPSVGKKKTDTDAQTDIDTLFNWLAKHGYTSPLAAVEAGETGPEGLEELLRHIVDCLRSEPSELMESWRKERRAELFPRYQEMLTKALAKKQPPLRGGPGRRGYPLEALAYARKLRSRKPMMKAATIRAECLKHFPEDDLPPDGDSFRAWLNRKHKRTNRTN